MRKGSEMSDPRPYFVCTTPRSGSTVLCEALTLTGVAGRPAEYFEALVHSNLPRQPHEYFDGATASLTAAEISIRRSILS